MDETQPLLQEPALPTPVLKDDANIVDFDPDGDVDNPLDWPVAYKRFIVGLLALTAFTVTFTCISLVPIANRISRDLDGDRASKSASVLFVTIWEFGEAAGPLFIGPLSEIYGRYRVMNIANVLFIVATMLVALSQSSSLLIVARALTGMAVATNVLNPAIVGDMFIPEQRGAAMSITQLANLLGGLLGPVIGGTLAEARGWRQVIWMCVGLAVSCETLFLTCFRETYRVPILRRRAARLRKETGNTSLRTNFDTSAGQSSTTLWQSVARPGVVFLSSGVLQMVSLFSSVVFTYFYIVSTTLPNIMEDIYHLSTTATGLTFMSFTVGSTLGVIICHRLLDGIYVRLREANKGVGQPEYRLPLVLFGGITLPLAFSAYGWAAQLHLHLALFLLTIVVIGFTLMLAFLPLITYVVDAFGLHSASALTAVIVTRCLMGTFLPIGSMYLTERLGYGWGLSLIAAASICLAPIPILLLRYGAKWRQGSKYSREL